jgi:hypothetical protein
MPILAATAFMAISVASQPSATNNREEGQSSRSDQRAVVSARPPDERNASCLDQSKSGTDTPFERPEWWLVILGFPTLGLVAWQAIETHRAADAANKTLTSTLRPKLIVRKIWIHRGTQIPTLGVPDADPWKVEFEVSNIGAGRANVADYSFAISRIDIGLPTKITYMEGNAEVKPFSLEAGEEMQLSIPLDTELIAILRLIGTSGLALGYQNTDRIYFFGNARYTDNLGIARNIAVCRHYHNKSLKFTAVDDPDHEYSD